MKRYVLGFLFSPHRSHVVLTVKDHGPNGMAGHVNGIGGGIEEGETPAMAMGREAVEEVGAVGALWLWFGDMAGPGWSCDCFVAEHASAAEVPPVNDVGEKVLFLDVNDAMRRPDLMDNLHWLLPLALEHLRNGVVIEARYS